MSTEKVRKTGGNNVPLVEQEADAICIAGNIVDRQPQNGGNGLGCQDELAYTLTATDRHCIYARQWVDEFKDGEVVNTQSARQYKDATGPDLPTGRSLCPSHSPPHAAGV